MLSCYAPHICEEMYQILTGKDTITYESWPTVDESKLVLSEVEMVVQVNGKIRGKFTVTKDEDSKKVEEIALNIDTVKAQTDGKTIKKIIVIPNKIVNIVAI